MGKPMTPAQLTARMRSAQHQAERRFRAELDRVNRENQRRVDAYNRTVATHNTRVLNAYNAQVERVNAHNEAVNRHNKQADARNQATIRDLRRRLSAREHGIVLTPAEQALAERIREHAQRHADLEWDAFLNYATRDGLQISTQLHAALESLGVSVWFFPADVVPGASQSLQIDRGLKSSRCGIAVLTPAYLDGRFWTERELGVLLNKPTLMPVLHGVTFDDVAKYSGILPDLNGFETSRESVEDIAAKIAAVLLPAEDPAGA